MINLTKFWIKPPFWSRWFYPNALWSINTTKKVIYLTFDDGPIPKITPWVLSELKKFNAKATFFCVGENVQKHPEIYKQIIENQHSFGNHTFNHINGFQTSNQQYQNNITKCAEFVDSKLFRPPYGKLKLSQNKLLRKHGNKVVFWDVLSYDFDKNVSSEQCFNNVINNAENGSIIVFHDSIKASANLKLVLPRVLEHYSNLGFTFKGLPQ